MRKSTLTYIIFLVLISTSNAISQRESTLDKAKSEEINKYLIKLNQIVKLANTKHLEDVETKQLIDAAVKGLIQKLDPHTYYFTSEEVKLLDLERNGIHYSIGLNFVLMKDTATVLSVLEGGPAYNEGIRTGDRLLSINDSNLIGKSKVAIEELLNSGTKQNPLIVSFLPYNKRNIVKKTISPIKYPYFSVDASYLIDGTDIGYVAINRFMRNTHKELIDSIVDLTKKGMKKMIIDLRNNPGGSVEETYMAIDEFVGAGNVIFMMRGKDPIYNETYKSSSGGLFENIPLVVLVNKESASASEIFAGAVQDLDRGLIIGETTYGKGLVQRPYQFFDGSELWLTVAQYFTPSGRSIQRPYEHNESYGTLQDRIYLKDGMNIAHTTEVVPGASSQANMFRTRTGRTVVGKGGITPDYIINDDTLTTKGKLIENKNLQDKFILDYYQKNKDSLNKVFVNNFDSYLHEYQISKQLFDAMLDYASTPDNKITEADILGDVNHFKAIMKSRLAGFIWDDQKAKLVLLNDSEHLKKAIELMPVAIQILNQK
ncbi:MAG TPA: S41 family peptidase [Candidatus Kapabacteria bacterium]|nr:S41 family peptidase [Candidatus Kapabacteria bacterium]